MTKSELIGILENKKLKVAEKFLGETGKKLRDEQGLIYPAGLRIPERFLGALFTDQLIILSGPPGTGKTSLPFAIAEAIGAKKPVLIPVQPNWTDNQDLMGYYNPIRNNNAGGYTTTPFLDVILEASLPENRDRIYFVVLDEMNLAHIEYYFSTILSIMESKDKTIRLYSERLANGDCDVPPEVVLPDNLQIIGTLNMDETTKGISPKVIDRSYILEIPGDLGIENSSSVLMKDYGSDQLSGVIKEILGVSPSLRMRTHYGRMQARSFLQVDDFIAGKILPQIRDKKYEEDPAAKLVLSGSEEALSISRNKLERMTTITDEKEYGLDFWGTD